jgi:hypothetical protein
VLLVTGVLLASSATVIAAGCAFTAVGVLVLVNLGLGPRRLIRRVDAAPEPAGPAATPALQPEEVR